MCWNGGGFAGWSGVSGERAWSAGGDGFGESAALGVWPAEKPLFDDVLLYSCGSDATGCPGSVELEGKRALDAFDAAALWMSDGPSTAEFGEFGEEALQRSGGA